MTDTPVISDAEVEAFCRNAGVPYAGAPSQTHGLYREALAAFLKARVPEPITTPHYDPVYGSSGGWNACREAVLRGKP